MKIIAVMGSSKNGNTTEIVKYFEKQLTQKMPCDFEYLYLSDYPLDFCVGCHNCIFSGEAKCPHYMKVKAIEDRLLTANGVILATPGYMFSVTGIMKNFLDHVAYNCHRPKYFGKKAFLISSCTQWQEKGVFIPMQNWVTAVGFRLAGKLFVDMLPFPLNAKEMDKKRQKIARAAAGFARELRAQPEIKPDFGGVMVFHVFRTLSQLAPRILKADYQYYDNKNAYDKDTRWFIPAKVSRLKHLAAQFMAKRIGNAVTKMMDRERLEGNGADFKNRL